MRRVRTGDQPENRTSIDEMRRTPALSLPIVVTVGVPLHFGLSRARRVRKTGIGVFL